MAFKLSLCMQLFILNLLAIPITFSCDILLKYLAENQVSIAVIPVVGFILLFLIVVVSVWLVKVQTSDKKKKHDFSLYVFSVFGFTAVIDLGMALEFEGYLFSFVTQYFANGEPYLNCSFGCYLVYFDGTFMWAMYLVMIYQITNKKSYRSVSLYWSGSIINSMIVVFIAVFAGKHGIYPSTILNIPYAILPVIIGWKAWHNRTKQETKAPTNASLTNLLRFADCGFIVYLIFAFILAVIRSTAVIGTTLKFPNFYLTEIEPFLQYSDPAPFPKAQMLVYLFYFCPVYLVSIYGLFNPNNSPWMLDVSLIHAGASLNAQFLHIFTSIHSKTASHLHPPLENGPKLVFWSINLFLTVMPQLLLARCYCGFKSKTNSSIRVVKRAKNVKQN